MHAVLNINDERKLHIFSVMTEAHWLVLYLDGSEVQTDTIGYDTIRYSNNLNLWKPVMSELR